MKSNTAPQPPKLSAGKNNFSFARRHPNSFGFPLCNPPPELPLSNALLHHKITQLTASILINIAYYYNISENFLGIDCSGLVRKALINANIQSGFTNLSTAPLKKAFRLWYYDCTAKALLNSYKDFTLLITASKSINSLDYSLIKPGDIAVTDNRVHVLAYFRKQPMVNSSIFCKKPNSARI